MGSLYIVKGWTFSELEGSSPEWVSEEEDEPPVDELKNDAGGPFIIGLGESYAQGGFQNRPMESYITH